MPFRFRLAKVARYRQKLVNEQGLQVAAAQRQVSHLQTRIAAVDSDIAGHLREFCDADGAVISVQGMMARTVWVTHLEKVREEFVEELQIAQGELDRRRDRLNELWQDLEVLHKLREKQQSAWQAEQSRLENRRLDEIGQIRADRQRRSKVAS